MPLGDLLAKLASGEQLSRGEIEQLRLKTNTVETLIGFSRFVNSVTGEVTQLSAGPVEIGPLGIKLIDVDGGGRRPEIILAAGAENEYGRLAGYSGASGIASAYLTSNAYYDGTNWNIDAATKAGTIFQGSSSADVGGIAFQWRSVPEGANPRTPANLLTLNHSGMLQNPVSTETIASGVITVDTNRVLVDTQDAGATDNLDTINMPTGNAYGSAGAILVLSANDGTHDVVLKDGTGNLYLAGDFTLDTIYDAIVLVGTSDGTGWLEICRSNNA